MTSVPSLYAFPKSVRLRRSREFRSTLDLGAKAVGPLMVVFVKRRDEQANGGVRLGLIASRKVGNSVQRNRIKRHLREAFRQTRSELATWPKLADADLVVIARANAVQADSAQIAAGFRHGLKRLAKQLEARDRAKESAAAATMEIHGRPC